MTKEEEIMKFLHERVFDPVLDSPKASSELKKGVNLTIMRLNERNATEMAHYFWSAILGTEKSIGFAARMKKEGFIRFEEVFEEFRVKFDNKWLKS